jgi:glycosyltransferase involved in cell wall biosynthesis
VSQAKVYFVACCFPPVGRGNAVTNACVANGLAESFDVEVICIGRPRGLLLSYPLDEGLAAQLHPGLKVRRVEAANWWGLNELLYGMGLLPCYYLNWAWGVLRGGGDLGRERGAVFAVYPVFSDLVVAYFLSRRHGLPLLVDFRDDFAGVMGRGWRAALGWWYRFLERRIIAAADQVTVTTDHLRHSLIARHGLDPGKVTAVANVVPPGAAGLSKAPGPVFTVIYAGAISRHQRPEILLRAFAVLLDRCPELAGRIRIEIYGPANRYCRRHLAPHLGRGAEFLGFVPRAQVLARMAAADLGFLSLGSPVLAYATPTKMFEYLELGKPILASLPPGATRELIEARQLGLVADAGDAEELAEHLHTLYQDRALRTRLAANALRLARDLAPEVQLERWRRLIGGLLGAPAEQRALHARG